MKISSIILALCFSSNAAAFTVSPLLSTKRVVASSVVVLNSTPLPPAASSSSASLPVVASSVTPPAGASAAAAAAAKAKPSPDVPYFPLNLLTERVQGGKTVRTFQMPPWAERVQMYITTNGRPIKATCQLWLGPIRNTHTMEIDSEDGKLFPFRSTLKFKKDGLGQVLKISTSAEIDLPVDVAVTIPSEARSNELAETFEKLWADSPKQRVQGGSTSGGSGVVRVFPIPTNVNAVQFMIWARDTGKKSFKAKLELLQGPNNKKQVYDLQCGGGSQPYHAIFETPGPGWVLRIINKKFVEDGLFECAVIPYEVGKVTGNGPAENVQTKQWWS